MLVESIYAALTQLENKAIILPEETSTESENEKVYEKLHVQSKAEIISMAHQNKWFNH